MHYYSSIFLIISFIGSFSYGMEIDEWLTLKERIALLKERDRTSRFVVSAEYALCTEFLPLLPKKKWAKEDRKARKADNKKKAEFKKILTSNQIEYVALDLLLDPHFGPMLKDTSAGKELIEFYVPPITVQSDTYKRKAEGQVEAQKQAKRPRRKYQN